MGTPYEKLRPGPGKPALEVSSHQRTRIQGAMVEIVAAEGYDAVTVRKLACLAGVSSRSFYAIFEEKEQCFLSTYEQLVRRTARRMVRSQRLDQDWRQRLHQGLRALTRDLAAEPKAAQLLLVEAFAVGPPALGRMSHAEAIFEAVVKASLAEAPEEVRAPPFVARAIVAGATRVAREQLLAGRVEELPAAADELMEWALSYACGAGESGVRRGQPTEPPAPREDAELEQAAGRFGQVRGDERALILAAVAKLAASEGYAALSLARIRAVAGVSRRAFDGHFDGVEECFFEAVESLGAGVFAEATREGAEAATWPVRIHRAVDALCTRVAGDRAFARLAFLEILAPGCGGMRHRERLVETAAGGLRGSAPPGQRPSKLAAEASVGAAWDVIHHHVACGRASRLSQQATPLTFLLLAPVLGGAMATTAIQGELAV